MKATTTTLALLLLASVAVAGYYGVRYHELRSKERDWLKVRKDLRYACMDNFLRREPPNSAVVLFRDSCLLIGVWKGPPAEP